MGGDGATMEVEESAAGAIKVVTAVTVADSGKVLRHDGSEVIR